MVQTTANAPPTTTTTVSNIADQDVDTYRGDPDRPVSRAKTTVPNPPRENNLPRDEDSILTRTLNYDAPASGGPNNGL